MTQLKYRDTRDFVAIDADKGIDHRTGKMVHADELAPEGYEQLKKCKHCANFHTSSHEDGENSTCWAEEQHFIAYGDMIAETCVKFVSSDTQH